MDNRSRTFQTLKPVCVDLGQKALYFTSGKTSAQEVIASIINLRSTLKDITGSKRHQHDLNDKLAEYTFFPLTHIFRVQQRLPLRATEEALLCLDLLLRSGWKSSNIPADLTVQLLILLTTLANGNAGGPPTKGNENVKRTSEELTNAAFTCLASLYVAAKASPSARAALIDTANIPALGHAVSTILDGAVGASSSNVPVATQETALGALAALHACLPDQQINASFLPGVVSALTKILTPSTGLKRPYGVLAKALELLSSFLTSVLSDSLVAELLDTKDEDKQSSAALPSELTPSWLRATAAQVKLALASVFRQKNHDRLEVRRALQALCVNLLEHCRQSLAESLPQLLEVMIRIGHVDEGSDGNGSIKRFIHDDFSIAETIRESLYHWLVALPRIMQSNDDAAKQRSVGQIISALHILTDADIDMSIIESVLGDSLRDSVINAIHVPTKIGAKQAAGQLDTAPSQLITFNDISKSSQFATILVGHKSGKDTLNLLHTLVDQIAINNGVISIAQNLLDVAQHAQDERKLANFWLSLNILRSSSNTLLLEDILDLGTETNTREIFSENMYSFSLSQLEDVDDLEDTDWRIRAMALEGLALRATQMRTEFRNELVDALYPVLRLMGSPVGPLRDHAIKCLNIIADVCGYADAKDLVTSNVDYLVNAVGLKLSSFDISPQLPLVLQMMIKLAGPSLLPFLDDLVDSVFEALECYHGYPTLVEILFSVLRTMVEEGIKAPKPSRAIKDHSSESQSGTPMDVSSLAAALQVVRHTREKRLALRKADDIDNMSSLPEATPQRPWKKLRQISEPMEVPGDDAQQEGTSAPEEPAEPKLPKTFKLLDRIAQLTQYHFSSSSSNIRMALLSLLRTALPHLSMHSDTFLPLINTLWPVLVSRLADKEAFVIAGVLDTMGLMIEGAGSFMAGRIEKLWLEIRRIWRDNEKVLNRLERTPQAKSTLPYGDRSTLKTEKEIRITAFPTLPATGNTTQLALLPPRSRTPSQNSSLTLSSSTHRPDTKSRQPSQSSPSATPYVPTPTLHISDAITTFCLRILQHLATNPDSHFPRHIAVEITTTMLGRQLLASKSIVSSSVSTVRSSDANRSAQDPRISNRSAEVRRVCDAWDADAVWLFLERERKGRGGDDNIGKARIEKLLKENGQRGWAVM